MFFDDALLEMITYQSNLYSEQRSGTSINMNKNKLTDFLAIELSMGIVKMSAYTDYWSVQFRYDKIADIMPLKKYQEIRCYLYFVDNNSISDDRFYKIRPVMDHVRRNFLKIQEERMSIDEMMVPYKGKKAGWQWGFKLFLRCVISGMVYVSCLMAAMIHFEISHLMNKKRLLE
uniref:PiggyBac transposable element-derived protein 1-like isoform X1 n=1 Tax=Diabrotica virgifera virgifera TaxID=50390 RepID=A0A6P7GBR4_DIAVI